MGEFALVFGEVDGEVVSRVEWRGDVCVLAVEFQVDYFACAVLECDL